MLPSLEILLNTYFFTMYGLFPMVILLFLIGFTTAYYIGYMFGIKYVWENGIPHTQKEYRKAYIKWKNKIN